MSHHPPRWIGIAVALGALVSAILGTAGNAAFGRATPDGPGDVALAVGHPSGTSPLPGRLSGASVVVDAILLPPIAPFDEPDSVLAVIREKPQAEQWESFPDDVIRVVVECHARHGKLPLVGWTVGFEAHGTTVSEVVVDGLELRAEECVANRVGWMEFEADGHYDYDGLPALWGATALPRPEAHRSGG